ncbi:MAG TPA: HD domain-containing phosphohydrolase [Bryobacteraceae bacterium]|nr:HD domain-containing phosphohydrolase [Bryobacteraceae bacterium]
MAITEIPEAAGQIRIAQVLSALSFALDLTEGQPPGHAMRSCIVGMHIAREIGLPLAAQSDLYYALLVKDAGCSTNASKMMQILGSDDIAGKRDAVAMDWTRIGWESVHYALSHVKTGAPFLERARALFSLAVHQKQNAKLLNEMRCERGSSIALKIGLSEAAARAILCLNEHWNGLGQPRGLRGEKIPLLSRIMNLAQTAEIFYRMNGPAEAVAVARRRDGRWFDPDVVQAFCSLAAREALWNDLENAGARVTALEPREDRLNADDATLDNICMAFADVIDAKSPFTYRHSTGVAGAAVAMAQALSLSPAEVNTIRRAALLHDIGKLGVSNTILDKPGKLTDDEWTTMRMHPDYTHRILQRIPGFSGLSEIAASHHEKLDGSGYFRGMSAEHLSLPARILVVADIYDALSAKRPYRDALPLESVLAIMSKDVPKALDPACFEALRTSSDAAQDIAGSLLRLSSSLSDAGGGVPARNAACVLPAKTAR